MVFCEPNAWYFPFYFQILLTPSMRWRVDKGVMNMRRGVLNPAFESNRFQRIQYNTYGFLPPQLYNHRFGTRLDQGLERVLLPPQAKAFQIITASL